MSLVLAFAEPALHQEWLRPGNPAHMVTLAGIALWSTCFLALGVRLKRLDGERPRPANATPRELFLRRSLGAAGLFFAIAYTVYWMTPPNYDPHDSLPLHVCDVMLLVAPLSMLVSGRMLLALCYFWGIGLSTQGFFTPVETAGPDSLRFWIFWLAHVQIVGIALYHIIVTGYRPRGRDCALAIAAAIAYIAILIPVDEIFGFNYGYVGSADDQPGIVSKLGAWPLRVVWMALIGISGFVALWIPWTIAGKRSAKG